jgi:hypothetical protein
VCLMYADVGGHELEILWYESTAHESFMLMWSNRLGSNNLL